MAKFTGIWTNFTAGELSPRLEGRVDLEKYYNGARTLLNVLVHAHGGASSRPGTYFVCEVKDSSKPVKLLPFVFSEEQAYVIEAGDQYMRFITSRGQLYTGSTPTEIATPWRSTAATPQMASVRFAQTADIAYFTHPEVEPQKLSRLSAATFTLASVSFTGATSAWHAASGATLANWPSAVGFFEQRSVWAGAPDQPQTLRFSVSGDYEDLTLGTGDDDAMEYTIAADYINRIRWLASKQRLIIGTVGAEWACGARSSLDPVTPSNIRFDRETTFGSADIGARVINHSVIFVRLHGKKLVEYGYDYNTDGYIGRDLTLLAEHITGTGITGFDWAQDPDAILWACREDGYAISGTYYPPENVMAWTRHDFGGEVEDICCVPNAAVGRDDVYFLVKRTINGATKRYIEYLADDFGTDVTDAFFVDCGLTYHDPHTITAADNSNPVQLTLDAAHGWSPGDRVYLSNPTGTTPISAGKYTLTTGTTGITATLAGVDGAAYSMTGGTLEKRVNSVSGLDHLEGEEVQILADGAVHPTRTVTSGAVSLDDYYRKVHVGLGFNVDIEPMRIEGGARDGTAQGRKKRIHKAVVRFYRTVQCKVGTSEDDLKTVTFRTTADAMDAPVPLLSEDKEITLASDWERAGRVFIRQDLPLPITVLAIMPSLVVSDE